MINLFLTPLFFLQTLPSQTEMQKKETIEKTPPAAMIGETRSYMMISPKDRANDFLKAYEFLVQEKSSSKVYIELTDGTKMTNVIEMKLMPGNTIALFRYTTPQGVKYQVVPIENIMGVHYQ